MLGNKTLHLKLRDTKTVPLNTVHRFFNDGDEDIEFAVELRPAHQGFEHRIYVFYGLASDRLTDDKGFPSMTNLRLPGQMGGYALAQAYPLHAGHLVQPPGNNP